MTTNNPESPLDPAQRPLEGADLGDDREITPGLDPGDTDNPGKPDDPVPGDKTDTGGPDSQLAAEKD